MQYPGSLFLSRKVLLNHYPLEEMPLLAAETLLELLLLQL